MKFAVAVVPGARMMRAAATAPGAGTEHAAATAPGTLVTRRALGANLDTLPSPNPIP